MKKVINISVAILVCLLVGYISSRFQIESIAQWYPTLEKAPLTPPNIAFPIAWTILYILMGISIGLVLSTQRRGKNRVIVLFILQLVCNFFWSILFFYFKQPLWGLIDIIILDILVLLYITNCLAINKVSAGLCVPYLLWLLFATYLNAYIYIANNGVA